ncbi:hypothetical protein DLM78_11540 [Leptospira stimsonii]|uniref:Uncharacterized protein n=1 Tax=Leptospira stimsonii TaxID=2202203 RepID=A0A8B3CQK3_9LEPT|nr:hypothetical protein DLM78_11540 [Leptospira stimsonii]
MFTFLLNEEAEAFESSDECKSKIQVLVFRKKSSYEQSLRPNEALPQRTIRFLDNERSLRYKFINKQRNKFLYNGSLFFL